MAKFPYTNSGAGAIVQTVTQLRRSFPSTVTVDYYKKIGLAPGNEGYLINILKFLGLLDDKDNRKTESASSLFSKVKDEAFKAELATIVHSAYDDLFDVHGDAAWLLDRADLMQFFRGADQTSHLVGGRQAQTFEVLAELAGQREASAKKPATQAKAANRIRPKKGEASPKETLKASPDKEVISTQDVRLTVRVEVNVPAGGSAADYGNIFRSIRKHLIDGSVLT